MTLTRLSLAQGAQPFDLVRTLPSSRSLCLCSSLANHLEEPINGPLIASLCLGSREWSQLMLMLTNKTELSLPSHLHSGLVPSLHMPRKLCQGSRKNILNRNSVYRADKIVPEYTPAYPKSRTRCRPLPTSVFLSSIPSWTYDLAWLCLAFRG